VHWRGKTWAYVVDVGRDPGTGRRRQQTKGGFRTKRAAEDAMAELIRSVADGSYVAPDPQTLAQWIERWLVTIAPKVRSSTLRDSRTGLGRVTERLGHIRLQALRPLDIEEFYASLLEDGHRYGGGLAPKTVRNVHIALRRSLADALRFGLVQRNVAALVKPPAPVRPELVTWDAADVRTFLASVELDRNAPAYRLLATTGMRRGEALGLRWADIAFDAERVTINRSLSVVESELVWSTPKTARSRRNVSLDPETVATLKAHRRRQLEERVAAGDAWDDADLVFCDQLGTPLHPDRFTRPSVRLCGAPA
jgi:integrase